MKSQAIKVWQSQAASPAWNMAADELLLRHANALGQAVLIAVVYAALDEWHQSWTDERFGSPLDVAIDSVGATVGAAFFAWLSRRKTGTTSP